MLKYLALIALVACGVEKPTHYDLKVGGDRELQGQDLISRYTVRLDMLIKKGAQGISIGGCSGTLLSPLFVLTAAHCVTSNPWRVKVTVGGNRPIRLADGKTYSEVAEVEAAIFHSLYNKSAKKLAKRIIFKAKARYSRAFFLNDIAVLKLKKPLNLPYKIDFTIPADRGSLKGKRATIAGYGIGDMGQVPRRGRYATAKIVDNFYDLMQFNNFFNRMNFGDSGGPVWHVDDNTGELELIGVNAFMIWILRLNSYSVDVRAHRQWVYDAMETLKSGYQQPLKKHQHRLIMAGVAEDALVADSQ